MPKNRRSGEMHSSHKTRGFHNDFDDKTREKHETIAPEEKRATHYLTTTDRRFRFP